MVSHFWCSLVLIAAVSPIPGVEAQERQPPRAVAPLAVPAAAGPLRVLLVDDDWSDNNQTLGDERLSTSDTVFRGLVAEVVGADARSWDVEVVEAYKDGPGLDRLRPFSLIVWYTGANYGGNPDNSGVLSIEDEKTVRRYLEAIGGAVVLVSPGYASKVLGYDSTWGKSSWPFLTEVMGVSGGVGLAQRFEAGTITDADGKQVKVEKGDDVESQFSAVNPDGATVLFTSLLRSSYSSGAPMPVATVSAYGRGRFIYIGFTLENVAAKDRTPTFQTLIGASGLRPQPTLIGLLPVVQMQTLAAPTTTGSGPTAVQVTGTPTTAVVSWTLSSATVTNVSLTSPTQTVRQQSAPLQQAPGQALPLRVERLVANAAAVQLSLASPDATQAIDPGPLTPGQAVTYRVTVTDATGTGFKDATYTPPLPVDPDGLSAAVLADGSIVLSWPEVPGVASYQIQVDDNRIAPAVVRNATEWRSPRLDGKLRRWTVNSVYEPVGSLTSPADWPSAQTPDLPAPGAVFLSKPAGAGSTLDAAAHYNQQCGELSLANCAAENVLLTSVTWQNGTWGQLVPKPGGAGLSDVRVYPTPRFYSVSFADVNDLGRGRRVGCADGGNYSGDPTFVCWATSHGPIPAPGTAVNGAALAQAANQYTDRNDMGLSTIVITGRGAMFGSWAPPALPWTSSRSNDKPTFGERTYSGTDFWWGISRNDLAPDWLKTRNWTAPGLAPWQREAIVAAVSKPAMTTTLDNQGPKSVPHACLSCHGGRYDTSTGLVQGASLLPLIPADLVFSSQTVRSSVASRGNAYPDFYQDSETAIRGINIIVFRSNPSPTIKARLVALYGTPSSPSISRPSADDLAVPPGWSTQRGLYQQVIAPYCGSCHFAQTGPLSFGSWAEVLQQKQAIQRTVCSDFTMPHSEILFRKFWTQTGAVSLPGLLSTSLGFSECR